MNPKPTLPLTLFLSTLLAACAGGRGSEDLDCGNGTLETRTEECDDGNNKDGDNCDSICRIEVCGNEVIDPGIDGVPPVYRAAETCDDGNKTPGDGCNEECQKEECGNGVLDAGEECEILDDDCGPDCKYPSPTTTTTEPSTGLQPCADDTPVNGVEHFLVAPGSNEPFPRGWTGCALVYSVYQPQTTGPWVEQTAIATNPGTANAAETMLDVGWVRDVAGAGAVAQSYGDEFEIVEVLDYVVRASVRESVSNLNGVVILPSLNVALVAVAYGLEERLIEPAPEPEVLNLAFTNFYVTEGTPIAAGNEHVLLQHSYPTWRQTVLDLNTGNETPAVVDGLGIEAVGTATDISADGRFVTITTDAQLDANDNDTEEDVYLIDRDSDGNGVFDEEDGIEITLVSQDTGWDTEGFDGPKISDDGAYIFFLGPVWNSPATGVWVHERLTGTTANVTPTTDGAALDEQLDTLFVSPTGKTFAFRSWASNLDATAPNDGSVQLYLGQNTLYVP